MGTKLESLIQVLTDEGTEKEVLDKLVLDYFNRQYIDSFETADQTYEVLTQTEKEEQLYDIAEGLFYDYEYELERLAARSDNPSHLRVLIDSLDERIGIERIIEVLDFEDELKKELVGFYEDYYVYIEA